MFHPDVPYLSAIIFDSIASCVFASTPAPLLTYSPLATCLLITMNTPSPKTTDVAFETSAPTYVLQMAPSATVESTIACHALGMVFDPGINFSMDSTPSNFHPRPGISFSPFIFQFALALLFAVSISHATNSSPPSALLSVPQHSLVTM